MDVVVARIGRPHGLHGDVSVELRTDDPEGRLAPGTTLRTEPAAAGPLTIDNGWVHSGRLLLHFQGYDDRTAAEGLRGQLVEVDRSALPPLEEGEYYHADLIGLDCVDREGASIGKVAAIENFGAGDLLDVEVADGRRSLIPFKPGIADLEGGRIVLDPEFLA